MSAGQQLTDALPQFGRTVRFSTLFLYCSFVFGLTDPNSPLHFATLLVQRLTLVVRRKFRSFNQQHHPADIASNSQAAAMPVVSCNAGLTVFSRKFLIFDYDITS